MILNRNTVFEIIKKDEDIDYMVLKTCFFDMKEVLLLNKKKLGEDQANETGKGLKFCIKEVERAACLLEYGLEYIDNEYSCQRICSDKFQGKIIRKSILGKKVLAISTFSSPYNSFIHKMMGILLAGGVMFFKPSPKVNQCSLELYKLLEKILLKHKLHNIHILVNIKDKEIKEIIERLQFDVVLFTGKSATARTIKELLVGMPAIYETGSSALAYISNDFDCYKLKNKLFHEAFNQGGMRCIALKNLFVQEEIYDNVKKILIEDIERLVVGDANDLQTDIGPMKDKKTMMEIINYIGFLQKEGYSLITGGIKKGEFLMPTLLEENYNSQVQSLKEMYGPVMIMHCVKGFRDIPRMYYERSSLQSSIYSFNQKEIMDFICFNKCCGNICINYGPALRIDKLPFGGIFDENEGKESLQDIVRLVSKEQLIILEDEDVQIL